MKRTDAIQNCVVVNKTKPLQLTALWNNCKLLRHLSLRLVGGGLSRSCGKRVKAHGWAFVSLLEQILLDKWAVFSNHFTAGVRIQYGAIKFFGSGKQLQIGYREQATNQWKSTNRYLTVTTKVHSALCRKIIQKLVVSSCSPHTQWAKCYLI